MKNKQRKYIIYLNEEYVRRVCDAQGVNTMKGVEEVRHNIFTHINRFLKGEYTQSVMMADIFIDSRGNKQKSFEIYRLSDMAEIKTLADLKRLQKRKGMKWIL